MSSAPLKYLSLLKCDWCICLGFIAFSLRCTCWGNKWDSENIKGMSLSGLAQADLLRAALACALVEAVVWGPDRGASITTEITFIKCRGISEVIHFHGFWELHFIYALSLQPEYHCYWDKGGGFYIYLFLDKYTSLFLTVEQECHRSNVAPEAASQPCGYHACSLWAAKQSCRSLRVKLKPP